jgi:GAF domain-containing protein
LSEHEPGELAAEQAALRRVATLVAGEAAPEDVFAVVTEEVEQLLPVEFAIMSRYDSDGSTTVLAASGPAVANFHVGHRSPLGGENVSTLVFETAHTARIDQYSDRSSGAIGAAGRERGVRSTVATPIIVERRVWGVMIVGTTVDEPLPADTEARLRSFTELVAIAIANAASRAGLARLVEEQAALRRLATLVARGAGPEEVFAAVVEEVGRHLPADFAHMGRYDPEGTTVFVGAWARSDVVFPVGMRRLLAENHNLGTMVLETGRPARIKNLDDYSGPAGVAIRERGVRSGVGTPIVVEGRLWGLMAAGSTGRQPLPADTEPRLASFTELVATAIANAESRAGLARLANEQAALRRVATLVARGVPPEEVFAAVTEEVGQLLPVDLAIMGRFEGDGTGVVVAGWGVAAGGFPAGSRWQLEGENLATTVSQTGRPVRNDRYADASGPIGVTSRESGFRSGVATPITVERRLWGVIVVGSTLEQPLPADTEARLASFTELVVTAIANAESRAHLGRLAEEQAALRRVATLVARGVAPEEVFAAVAEEVERVLPVNFAHVGRYAPEGAVTVLGVSGTTAHEFPVGRQWTLGGDNLATIVYETGRPGRIDGYRGASGLLGDTGRELGIRSSAGTPIIVEGDVWGVIIAGSTLAPTLPADTEARLASFTELVATAIANAESRAALAASRARIVAAADESRRRIERDLHDGAQQRLVHAVIVLKLALRALTSGETDGAELVAEALRHAEQANAELRELAHGILPAALTRGGLRAGVDAIVSRTSLPVSVDISVERLPVGVEATAYFVISEALTNVVKHARAASATVTAHLEAGELRVEVGDDGIGGAQSGHHTGLGGLEDRVSALDGRLVVESPTGAGTRVRALLPVPEG